MNEPLTIQSLAALLNGREYRKEITEAEESMAKDAGLIVLFGYSDDNVELSGFIRDEVSAYEGATIYLHKGGLLPNLENDDCERCREWFKKEILRAAIVEASWNGKGDPCWSFETKLPNSTFNIFEDGGLFCIGIVIDVKDLPTL